MAKKGRWDVSAGDALLEKRAMKLDMIVARNPAKGKKGAFISIIATSGGKVLTGKRAARAVAAVSGRRKKYVFTSARRRSAILNLKKARSAKKGGKKG